MRSLLMNGWVYSCLSKLPWDWISRLMWKSVSPHVLQICPSLHMISHDTSLICRVSNSKKRPQQVLFLNNEELNFWAHEQAKFLFYYIVHWYSNRKLRQISISDMEWTSKLSPNRSTQNGASKMLTTHWNLGCLFIRFMSN